MHVTLKALSARNTVNSTKWKTTDLWLGVARPISSPTLLERSLQMVLHALTHSSVQTARVSILLITSSIPSGTTALTGNDTLTRLLNYTQVVPVIAISNALEWATSDYVWYNQTMHLFAEYS